MVTMEQIRASCNRIAREFKPDRIILFGSYADGQPTADSDVDLLVVLPHRGRVVDKSVEIRLRAKPPFPLDLLVRTPEKVEERIAMGDLFMRDIMEEGEVLYEAHDE